MAAMDAPDAKSPDREESKMPQQREAGQAASAPEEGERRLAGQAGPGVPERLDMESRQALEQWLERIPDNPGGLLREKFLREYRRGPNQTGGLKPW